jgi:CRISPR type IV-associated protein Csf2
MKVMVQGVVTTTGLTHQTSPEGDGQHIKTSMLTKTGILRDIPYITANSVRGLIRRAAAELVFEQLCADGMQISRNAYLSVVRGAFARTGIKAGGANFEEMAAARSHVFAGLFGGGVYMYRSAVRMERDLYPILAATAHLMPREVQQDAVELLPRDLLTQAILAPRDDFARLPQAAREVVKDLSVAYSEHMATKERQAAAKDAAKAEGKNEKKDDLDNFGTTQCMVPGVPLCFGVTASNINAAQAGLLLQGILRWANTNALGGGSARGRGTFTARLVLTIDGKLVTSNLLVGEAPELRLAQCEEITALVQACAEALKTDATPQSLSLVFPSDVRDADGEDKPKKGRASKGKAAGEASEELSASGAGQ